MTEPLIRVLSLGAGVQSSTLALMAAHGEIGPMPDCAIFADTGNEPAGTYDYLDWLVGGNVLPFPIHKVRVGPTLEQALKAGDDMARVPFHVGKGGLSGRQCTRNWKLRPIRRKIREILGVGPRGYLAPGSVESWVGISMDEIFRVKPSGVAFITNRHPLVEARINRRQCEAWLVAHDYPVPPKSSCVFCPYRRNAQWVDLQATDPAGWKSACALDAWLREPPQVARFHGELFVHQSRVPLALASIDPAADAGQGDLFNHECEGMCGV